MVAAVVPAAALLCQSGVGRAFLLWGKAEVYLRGCGYYPCRRVFAQGLWSSLTTTGIGSQKTRVPVQLLLKGWQFSVTRLVLAPWQSHTAGVASYK